MKTWLITECSSGFGRNLAETLLSEGEQVIVTARKPKTIQHFAKNYPLTADRKSTRLNSSHNA